MISSQEIKQLKVRAVKQARHCEVKAAHSAATGVLELMLLQYQE